MIRNIKERRKFGMSVFFSTTLLQEKVSAFMLLLPFVLLFVNSSCYPKLFCFLYLVFISFLLENVIQS